MIPRIALAAALAAAGLSGVLAAGVPARAQGISCPAISIVATGTSTAMVPRMGPGSDLLTQSAVFQNTTANEVQFTITIVHRAFQQNFVMGQTYRLAGGARQDITLGNVVKPGVALSDIRLGVLPGCTR
ncbi:MAG: hypothetical protein K2X11_18230 [Acetobacteraceae bacterium]|nr:hypothetical protein [Acetobacteraceae bacterium]